MKYFVTGASGYIGLTLVHDLLSNGHTVLALTHSPSSFSHLTSLSLPGLTLLRGDITNHQLLTTACSETDGVAHLAFDHDFTDLAGSCARDYAAVEAMISALEGSGKPLVISSGTLMATPGKMYTEEDVAPQEWAGAVRGQTEEMVVNAAKKGIRSAVIRLPPTVQGGAMKLSSFVKQLISGAKKHGHVVLFGSGETHWPAINVRDAATLYRFALEQGTAGWRYHAVAELNTQRDIAQAIAKELGLEVKQVGAEEAVEKLGFVGRLVGMDNLVSGEITKKRTGWTPKFPGLVENLKNGLFFD